jgi:hypothetical protein
MWHRAKDDGEESRREAGEILGHYFRANRSHMSVPDETTRWQATESELDCNWPKKYAQQMLR